MCKDYKPKFLLASSNLLDSTHTNIPARCGLKVPPPSSLTKYSRECSLFGKDAIDAMLNSVLLC